MTISPFPKHSQLADAVFSMVVAGRVVTEADGSQDVAIMMIEAEATDNVVDMIAGGAPAPTEAVVAEGLEAAKPFIERQCLVGRFAATTDARLIHRVLQDTSGHA